MTLLHRLARQAGAGDGAADETMTVLQTDKKREHGERASWMREERLQVQQAEAVDKKESLYMLWGDRHGL